MTCPSFDPHDHAACRATALSQAESACAAQGLQFTPMRRRVLDMLLGAPKAMRAYDILERVTPEGQKRQPPAVYRALDFLTANDFAHRLEKLNAYVACACPGAAHRPAFLICRVCDRVAEATDVAPRRLGDEAVAQGFRIERTVVEAVGLCSDCAA